MIEEIKFLVQDINNTNLEVDKSMKDLIKIDEQRLELAVNTAIPGLSFNKIWSSKKGFISKGQDQVTYEYLEYNGKNLKALKVGKYIGPAYSEDDYKIYKDTTELWFNAKGFYITHVTGIQDKNNFGEISLVRELLQVDADPLEINEETKDYYWDVDIIIKSIISGLKDRVESLNKRVIIQKQRLVTLKSLINK